jgi:hypothetical protein
MIRKAQSEFNAARFVSIWLGNFASEFNPHGYDEYFAEHFEDDFGFTIYPPAGPEYCVNEEGPIPVRQLFDAFSRSETFIDGATEVCISKGWFEATTAIVFYHMKYDPTGIEVNPIAPLKFIGIVPMRINL